MIEWLMILCIGVSSTPRHAMQRVYTYKVFSSSTALMEKYNELNEIDQDNVKIFTIVDNYEIKPVVIERFRLEKKR